jgi:AraC-like DNA-binding protein
MTTGGSIRIVLRYQQAVRYAAQSKPPDRAKGHGTGDPPSGGSRKGEDFHDIKAQEDAVGRMRRGARRAECPGPSEELRMKTEVTVLPNTSRATMPPAAQPAKDAAPRIDQLSVARPYQPPARGPARPAPSRADELLLLSADPFRCRSGLILRGRALGLVRLNGDTARETCQSRLVPWQLRKVTDFMRAHLAETLQLSELAAISGLSISHFSRAFKGSTGLPPHRWHLNMRIDMACKMLADASPSLADVAYATGFADQSHFTRLFSRISSA